MRFIAVLSILFFLAMIPCHAQPKKKGKTSSQNAPTHPIQGLSFSFQGGTLFANSYSAGFYSGAPENTNTINRVLHSEVYGYTIWNYLIENHYISASEFGSYEALQITEYGKMHYNVAISFGFGFQYNLNVSSGIFGRFTHASLNAKGIFLINTGDIIPSNFNNYLACPVLGIEKRNGIDLGYLRRFPLSGNLNLCLEAGVNMTSIKVSENQIKIGDLDPISILDVWGKRPPVLGQYSMEYIQNGPSFGFSFSPALSYSISSSYMVDLGWSFLFLKTNLDNYEKLQLQNTFFIRFFFSKRNKTV